MATSSVILAGGLGTRIGGAKALQPLQDRPLIAWVLEAIRPQCDGLLVSANDDPDVYAQYGCRVVADRTQGYAGPLAGLQAALMAVETEWLASVPCDAPFLPPDLIAMLHAALQRNGGEAAVAVTAGRRQPAIALYHHDVLPRLNDFLAAGGRKVTTWQDSLQLTEVPFDDAASFINLNSAQELALANQILNDGGTHDDIQRALA